MMSGRLSFTGDFDSIVAQKLTQPPESLADLNGEVPPQLKQLVVQMLAKESDKRPEDMNQATNVLRSVSGQLAV